MNISYENTRALGIGEKVLPTDFCYIESDCNDKAPYLAYVDEPEVGHIVNGEEFYEYRRSLQGDPYEAMFAELGLQTDMAKEAFKIICENVRVMDTKQQDYGSGNISAFGEFGVLVRLNDKIERLKNLNKMPSVKNEAIDDSYLDIANYAVIAMLIRRNLWK
jgi:hypothetical protein